MSTQLVASEEIDRLSDHEIVSRADWLVARKDLLKREKELTRLRDQLSAERRALPWVKIEKEYVFDAPEGKVTLADLFEGRSQLFIKHFMMGPGQTTQCVGCSLEVDHLEGILVHLQNHDVSYIAVARAPIDEIELVRKRMGWKFPWVSSYHSDFNYTSASHLRASRLLPVALSTITKKHPNGRQNWKISLATASFLRTKPARSSIPIRLSAAGERSSSGFTGFSMRCRRGAMKTVRITASRIGLDRGTCTAKGEAWNPTGATTNQPALVQSINQQPRKVSMNTDRCCENSNPRTFARRYVDVFGWIIPGAILAILPKCPMCLAAYIALWSGIGLSLSAATHLRVLLLMLSVGLILFMVVRNTRRLIHKFDGHEKIIWRSAVC